MLKAIIFDMDGVLVNSTKYNKESQCIILKEHGVYISDEEYKKYLGRSLKDILKMWEAKYNIELPFEEFRKRNLEIQIELMKEELKPKLYISNFLKGAHKVGIKVAVATSSTRFRTELFLKLLEIKDVFDVIVCAEDVSTHKPNPEVFLKTAERLGVEPKNCVVIEDAANGIQAAKSAGMKAVGLINEFHTAEELSQADLVINSLEELKTLNKLDVLF